MIKKEEQNNKNICISLYENILYKPDNYIGKIELQKESLWIYNKNTNKFEYKEIEYVPGLLKCFEEILIRAFNSYKKDKSMTFIEVDINQKENIIKIKNDGKSIPILFDKTKNQYIPHLLFSDLSLPENKLPIKNVGVKLTNIYSTSFIIEIVDKKTNKKYIQEFFDNMLKYKEPKIEEYIGDDLTCFTFKPDLKRFNTEK